METTLLRKRFSFVVASINSGKNIATTFKMKATGYSCMTNNTFRHNSALLFSLALCVSFTLNSFSQAASATWNLTANGNAAVTGAITANAISRGSDLTSISYNATNGVSTNSWANDATTAQTNQYYQYKVTPVSGNKLTINSITLNHSINSGNWLAGVFYSYDNFLTPGTQIGTNFISATTTQTALSLTGLSLTVPNGGSFSIRIYAWESDGTNRRFRNRNVVISGTTCVLPTISSHPLTQTICVGSPLNISVTASDVDTYQWKKDGVDISGATSNSYSIPTVVLGDSGNYTVEISNSCQTISSNTAAITVNDVLAASVTINSTASTICYGTNVEFTATTTNGGDASYQWKLNGSNVGTNSVTYSSNLLNNNDVITCTLTSSTPCLTGLPYISNQITITVNTLPVVSGITSGSNIGSGTVTLGAAAVAGTISWYDVPTGGIALGTGTSFTTPIISDTTPFYAEVFNGTCYSSPRTAIMATIYNSEINIQGNSVNIIDGDTTPTTTDWTDFSSVATVRTFSIFNTGNADLTIDAITFTGTNASDFTIVNPPSSTIPSNGSTTFNVKFTPSAIGTRTGTISIVTNDNDENPYNFNLQGFGVAQSINVKGNNLIIADGDTTPSTLDWTDFDSTNANSPITRVFTISNTGTMNLNLTGTPKVTLSGSSDFSITTQPTSPVQGVGTTTFIVTFTPTTVGIKTTDITIENDDASAGKNPYTFRIKGNGIQAFIDSDGDGVFNNIDSDDDNDGIPDNIEQNYASGSILGSDVQVTLLNETFGIGTNRTRINSNVPTASTTYCYEDGTTAMAADECDTNDDLNDGQYTVANEAGTLQIASWAPSYWYQGIDHTISDINGRMALFNSTNDITEEFYRTIVQGVITDAPLTYSFYVLNLDRTDAPGIATRNRPNITVEFRDLSNNLISSLSTGDIDPTTAGNLTGDWHQFSASFIPSTTGFSIIFRNNQLGGTGNDLALDDIVITQILTDSDQDGIADAYDLDSDNDGIGGIVEDDWASLSNGKDTMDLSIGIWMDTNGNGWHDSVEAYYASNFSKDFDGDSVPNYIDLDSDNDSIFDVDEAGIYNGDGDINCDGEGEGTDTDTDGILSSFDVTLGFGNSGKALPLNTSISGNPDYLNVNSTDDFDISKTLYASLDTDNDGVINGTTDIDRDGIIDAFDTDTNFFGSPRDLNRKLLLDFDGRNDYGQDVSLLNGLNNASIMGWIDLNNGFSSEGVVFGQDKFQLRITNDKKLEVVANSSILTHNTPLNTSQWYHIAAIYDSSNSLLKLFLNGKMIESTTISGGISDTSLFTIGKNPIGDSNYFKGKIDELRVFNIALTDSQLQKMVYQEIQNFGSQVRGEIIPKNIEALPFANLIRYFRMDVYKNDIIDNLATPTIDTVIGMKIFNNKNIYTQQAPMPFITERDGDFATAVNSPSNEIRGLDIVDNDWSIVNVKHNINETSNTIDLGMIVDSGMLIVMDNDTKLQNDWYLKLNGKIDLVGKSQLVQTTESDLDPTSAGLIERDQQGQTNKYNYNYWTSPVGGINATTNNNPYTVANVLKDGTDPNDIKNILWTSGLNSAATTPITLSSYWIFKFQNLSNIYANWASVGPNGLLLASQGFTLKGSNAATATQNLTFIGKPNSGAITSTVAPNYSNLTGNPYASALDSNAFITANGTSGNNSISGTIYFWEHYSTNVSHNLAEYQGGYATLNLTGGTPPIATPEISGLGSSTKIPGRYIPVGQGFFIRGSAAGGTILFNNNQRKFIKETNTLSNTLFRNTENAPENTTTTIANNQEDSIETDTFKKLRLGFTTFNNYHRQVLLGFMEEKATAAIDYGYDGIHIDNQPNDMYFIHTGKKLNIQGVGYFNVNASYPLGLTIGTAGNVKFSLDQTENFEENQDVFIYDNVTGLYHNIKSSIFEINLPIGIIENRFSLRFTGGTTLGTVSLDLENQITVVYTANQNSISIKNNQLDNNVKSVALFNILGQKITSWNVENQEQTNIKLFINNVSKGTYIVKITTDKGNNSKKIIIQ